MSNPPHLIGGVRLEVVVADITTLRVDAIVNAANTSLLGGGGVDGAIHRAAGPEPADGMPHARRLRDGRGARSLKGYRLPAKHVIHAVGPVWNGGQHGEDELLASCYARAIALCRENNLASIAFPAISTGRLPLPGRSRRTHRGLRNGRGACRSPPTISRVIFCCFSKDSAALHEQALADVGEPCPD